MNLRRVAPLLALMMAGCVAMPPSSPVKSSAASDRTDAASASPVLAAASVPPMPGPPPPPAILEGQYEQGGWIRGVAPLDSVAATLNGQAFAFDAKDRGFLVGLDRDEGSSAELVFTARDGQKRLHRLSIKPRDWQIERIDTARAPGGATEAFMKRRQPELDAIWAARQRVTGAQGWRQNFIWPVKGRISGRFGSQRIYRGEPGAFHSGLDIATGTSGTPYVAPADGVVVLAVQGYSLEGNLLIIDHGSGLNSAFLHSSRLYVKAGEAVKQGQHVGDIGMSGRATGPHLHWSIKWREARLDPLLFLPPAP